MTFDEVLPGLLALGLREPTLMSADRVVVVRDLRGRVRVVVEPASSGPGLASEACQQLEATLGEELGGWWAAPVLFSNAGTHANQRIARALLDHTRDRTPSWPHDWPSAVDDALGNSVSIERGRWVGFERTLSKEQWLSEQSVAPVWPLVPQRPTIVSFYSYKGGVGRSTLLALVAAQLADRGKHVVVLDLDLEAPGLHGLFDVAVERGVLDYLVDHVALEVGDLTNLLKRASTPSHDGPGGGSVRVLPAGRVEWSFVRKLARLDYAGHGALDPAESPVEQGLKALLRQIGTVEPRPDYILLDARTGLADLGGLAIHALAHVDVLVGRASPQDSEGLGLALRALARRKRPEDINLVLVQSMAPKDPDTRRARLERAREHFHEVFEESVWSTLDDAALPAVDDDPALHSPFPIPLDDGVAIARSLHEIDSTWVFGQWVSPIVDRILELGEAPT